MVNKLPNIWTSKVVTSGSLNIRLGGDFQELIQLNHHSFHLVYRSANFKNSLLTNLVLPWHIFIHDPCGMPLTSSKIQMYLFLIRIPQPVSTLYFCFPVLQTKKNIMKLWRWWWKTAEEEQLMKKRRKMGENKTYKLSLKTFVIISWLGLLQRNLLVTWVINNNNINTLVLLSS